jgi:hypothetical protein
VVVTTLLCYTDRDKALVKRLKDHLSLLERHRYISLWDVGSISPGAVHKEVVEDHFNEAQMILLLVSASFLASDYCFGAEVQRAIERHEIKKARVIPIILRPVYWFLPPLDKLRPLPDDAKAITRWTNQDDGFTNVATGILNVVKQWDDASFSDATVERCSMITNLSQLVKAIQSQMQPAPRADATANTLQQLSVFIPGDVTLADLIVGWRILSQPPRLEAEHPAITQRRVTCSELATIASQCVTEQGSLEKAIRTWQAWQHAFTKRDDPRQVAMVETFTRELKELQAFDDHSSNVY